MTGRARVFLPYTSLTGRAAWLEIFSGPTKIAAHEATKNGARLVVELAPGLWQLGPWSRPTPNLRRG